MPSVLLGRLITNVPIIYEASENASAHTYDFALLFQIIEHGILVLLLQW
jgi:hypothetical protein